MTEATDTPMQPNPIHAIIESEYESSKERYLRLVEEFKHVDKEYWLWHKMVVFYEIDPADSTTATTTPDKQDEA